MSNYACIPYIITREFDDQGNLLAFGRIETYQAGTTIPLETYADAGGFASNLNPVVLDASGSANIFLKGQAYKFVFRDADGNLIRTIDNVLGTASASGGSMVVVSNYAALRALTTDFDVVIVLGRNTPDDGGFGVFEQVPFAADDDGITLNRALVTSYRRQVEDYIDPRWFGVVYGQAVVQNAAMASAQAASTDATPVRYVGITYVYSFTFPGYAIIDAGCQFRSTSGAVVVTYDPDRITITDRVSDLCPDNVTIAPTREVPIHTKWFTGTDPQPRITGVSNVSTLILDSVVTMSANFAVDCNIDVRGSEGALIVPSSGAYSITISGGVLSAPDHRWIIATSAANVSAIDFGGSVARPEWFHEEGETNYAIALAVAMKAGRVELSRTYDISTPTTFPSAVVSSAIPSGVTGQSTFSGPALRFLANCTIPQLTANGIELYADATSLLTVTTLCATECFFNSPVIPLAFATTNAYLENCLTFAGISGSVKKANCRQSGIDMWDTTEANIGSLFLGYDKRTIITIADGTTITEATVSTVVANNSLGNISLAIAAPAIAGVSYRRVIAYTKTNTVTITGTFWDGTTTVSSLVLGGANSVWVDLVAAVSGWYILRGA